MDVKSQAKKKIFVTGGSGFLGRAIISHLLTDGFQIVALARRSNVPEHLKNPDIKLVEGDVRDSKSIQKAMRGVDFVVHAAATMQGSWDDFYQINVEATKTLLDAAVKHKVERFIYISSVSVYAHATMENAAVFTEDMPYEGDAFTNFYSKSKMEAEKLVWQAISENKLSSVILRPGAIYGPGGNIFPATLGLGLGVDKIILFGDSKTELPLSYVENVVDAIVKSIEQKEAVGECFNLVEDRTLSRIDYANALKSEANPNLKILRLPLWFMNFVKFTLKTGFRLIGKKAPLSALNLKLYCSSIKYSNEKYKRIFGAKPYVDFDESIHRTMQWHKKKRTPIRSQGLPGGEVLLSTKQKLNVGIIGCGNIAHVHLLFLKKFKNVGKIYIADPQPAALNAISKKYKVAKGYNDYQEMLTKEQIDVVHILAPPQFHAEITEFAAKQDCHVLVEKPMALDYRQAKKMLTVAQKSKIKLCVVHNHLYDKVMVKARDILAQGVLGRITYIESWYGTQFGSFAPPFDPQKYWGYSLPGSLYQDYLPHALYVLLDILGRGEIKNITANYIGGVPSVETDELKIMFEHEKKVGLLSLSLSVAPRYQFMNIYGTNGTVKIDFLNKVVFLDKEIGGVPKTINRALSAMKYSKLLGTAAIRNIFTMHRVQQNLFEGTGRIIRLFYRSILLDEPEPVPATEGLQVMNLLDQIWSEINTKESAPQKKMPA